MQAALDLTQLDDLILKQIVKKFSFRSGVNFYRSCRGAKEFVDSIKPVWSLPDSRLEYDYVDNRRAYRRIGKRHFSFIPFSLDKLCKVETVAIEHCDSAFIMKTVLPEIAALGAVGTLHLSGWIGSSWDYAFKLLLTVANPDTVRIRDMYCVTSYVFAKVKNLEVDVHSVNAPPYWMTTKIFQLAKNRKQLTLSFFSFYKKIVTRFLQNWLKGESTDSLERLTVSFDRVSEVQDCVIEDLFENCIKTPEGYSLKRGGDERLRICVGVNCSKIDFLFL